MHDGRGPLAVAMLFFVGAGVAAFVIGTPARSLRGEPAARTFLTAWRQSRTATFVVDSDFTRTLPDGNVLKSTVRVVQRPPNDRLLMGLGSTEGRLDGKIVRCAATPVGASPGSSRCFTSVDAQDYTAEVDHQITGLEAYVLGDRPLYRVVDFADSADHCFRLDLALQLPSPPYGNHAMFCFDRTNFAPTLTVIERDEATDRTEATSVRTTVTGADLQVVPDPGEVVGLPGPTTTSPGTTVTTVPGAN
jgi:hypothetical protein